MKRPFFFPFLGLVGLLLAACSSASARSVEAPVTLAVTQEATVATAAPTLAPPATAQPPADRPTPTLPHPAAAAQDLAAPTLAPTLGPDDWQSLPVIPQVGQAPLEIFRRGLSLGNNPHAFSKIGDCGSTPSWFLGDFDRGPRFYRLGTFTSLETVIGQYQGSFGRTSLAARAGFNASSVFTPLWANRELCQANEAPLACEYRVNRPSLALIMLGTNDVWHLDRFEGDMRQIIEFSLEQGVIPILTTKADNQEGDHSVNRTIARLAQEYDLPLWNYWRAAQELPDGGLQEDAAHLTWAPNRFDDPKAMQTGWAVRNLTALQTLEAVWNSLSAAAAASTSSPHG